MSKNLGKYIIPSFAVSGFDNGKKSLKTRFQSIFEDDKKKRGLVILFVVIILVLLAGSLLFFGDKEVEQVNDSLTVYIRGVNNEPYKPYLENYTPDAPISEGYYTTLLINDYKKTYPNVNLNVVNLSDLTEEEFNKKIGSELIAGKGPDIIVGTDEFLKYRDVQKLIKSGIFAELDEFINNDADSTFTVGNCFDNIMKSGRYQGRTYVIPVNFEFPIIYSTHDALGNAKIDIDKCTEDYIGFSNEVSSYVERIKDTDNKYLSNTHNNIYQYLNLMYQPENYDKLTFSKFVENYKYIYDYDTTKISNENHALCYYDDIAIFPETWSYSYYNHIPIIKLTHSYNQTKAFDTNPIMITLNQPNGDFAANVNVFAAINASSSNKQNSYNYIKMLAGVYNGYYTDSKFLPTNKFAFTDIISREIADEYIWHVKERNVDIKYPAYTKEDVAGMIKLIESIDVAYCKNPMTYEVEKIANEYYTGEISLEECIKLVDEKMTIYKSE